MLIARAQANGLDRPVSEAGPGGVADVARRTAGLQAQSWRGAAYAVRARSTATTLTDVSRAQEDDRSVVRGWFMRGTLQLVATEDAGWLLGLLGPQLIRDTERRYGELGLTPDLRERGADVIESHLLDHGPTGRAALGAVLVEHGILAEPKGQAVYALIRHTGLLGRLCYGPGHDAGETWVAVRDWLGGPLKSADSAADELARRYLTAYGPATAKDFATWSGLPIPAARQALRSAAREEYVIEGEAYAAVGDVPGFEGVRFLGEFDPYLLGYRDRRYALAEEHRHHVYPGGGMLRPAVVRGGRVIGSWQHVGPSVSLFGTESADLSGELADLARFHG
ncbi:winged helix DNA-binding protein [Kribbella amoyensis]|uniref:Winged helix DNA-binding protein n=1 Tax=Kribbella amoyensis TaxID=996641 RepID=A0A561BZD0_9ACTN|nr:winged helix DNA-binding protein [Kribbella amoyensis]